MLATPWGKAILLGRAGAAYVGPYDAIPSIAAAYGMRRLLSAYTGPILRLRRSSDNAEQDIGYVANGDLDTAAAASFVGGGSGFAVTWYDQKGSVNGAQASATKQAQYTANVKNGHPAFNFDATNDSLDFTATSVGATAMAVQPIAYNTNNEFLQKSDSTAIVRSQTPGKWRSGADGANSIDFTFTDGTVRVNGVATTTYSGFHIAVHRRVSTTQSMNRIGQAAGSGPNAYFGEIVMFGAVLNDPNTVLVEAIMNAYWAVY